MAWGPRVQDSNKFPTVDKMWAPLSSEDTEDVIYHTDLIFLKKLVHVLVTVLFLGDPMIHTPKRTLRPKTLNAFLLIVKGCISLVLITLRNSSTTLSVYLNMV